MINLDATGNMVTNPRTKLKGIKILSQIDKKYKSYKCFSISDLYNDLFKGDEIVRIPLINISNLPKDHRSILEFLLPDEIMQSIEARGTTIISTGNNNNYAGFFQFSVNDNKIRNLLYDVFIELGHKVFIEIIQNHITGHFENVNLSKNPELIEYLFKVGDQTLVPFKESHDANGVFHALIKDGSNRSLSLIIANFFISCLLGLRSMNYENEYYSTKNPSKKTYLLNGFGMTCVWKPDLITPPYERLNDSRQLYENGYYESAYDICNQWITKYEDTSSKIELALAYQLLGLSLFRMSAQKGNAEFAGRQSESIEFLEKSVSICVSDYSICSFLYDYFKDEDKK